MDRTDWPAGGEEVAAMRALAQDALLAEYQGISTGTAYALAMHASTQEIIDVCSPLTQLGGVYVTHMRNEGDRVLQSLEETAAIGKTLDVMTIVSHHKVSGLANHGLSVQTLAQITLLQSTQALGLDCYPYSAGSTALSADRVSVFNAYTHYAQRTTSGICGARSRATGPGVGALVRGLVCEAQTSWSIYFAMAEDDVERILAFPGTMIGSDRIPLQSKPHPRLRGTFPRVLGHYCRGRRLFSLETAVYKMSGLPAKRFRLVDRGLLAPGMAAVITVFDADAVIDNATFEDPELPSSGIDWVVVNGQVAWRQGHSGSLAGRLLLRTRIASGGS